jgi:integrase
MARQAEGPWFRASKGTWYATLNGKKVSLKVKGEENEAAATKAWHKLMAGDNTPSLKSHPKVEQPVVADVTVKDVADSFLVAKKGVVKETTHYVYGCLLKHITSTFGGLKASALKVADVTRWLHALPVGVNTRSDIAGILTSMFKWAEGEGIVSDNPVKGLKRPARKSRGAKAVVTEAAHKKLMKVASPALRHLLTMLRETGARPSELARLTAQDVDFANNVAVLTEHKTAVYGKSRLIVLTPKAMSVLKGLVCKTAEGPLLRNERGKPWKKDSIVLAMRRASERAGVKAIAYGYRHALATDALAKGIPEATVAALLGHSSTAMLFKHYGHLTSRTAILKKAAARIR